MPAGPLGRVTQGDDDCCGQCCVAMITGCKIDDVKDIMGCRSTDTRKLHEGLKALGFYSPDVLTRFGKMAGYENYKELNYPSILKLKTRSHAAGKWHWVVWDPAQRRILDPRDPPYKLNDARITSFLPVAKKGELAAILKKMDKTK